MISAFGKTFLSLYSTLVKLIWKLMKVLFGVLCINKIYCKRGVLSAKISTYPAFTGESGFEDREIVSTHPG